MNAHWVLTIICKDQPGIVHAVTGAIVAANGNITESSQFSSDDTGRFFMRLQIESNSPRTHLEANLAPVAEQYDMELSLDEVGRKLKTLVLVSKSAHCLNDILFRQRAGQLPIEIPAVFVNHGDLASLAEFYSIPFEVHPFSDAGSKAAFEHMLRDYIKAAGIELIVLARFMQILSPEFVADAVFDRLVYGFHPYGLPQQGTAETLASITRDTARKVCWVEGYTVWSIPLSRQNPSITVWPAPAPML